MPIVIGSQPQLQKSLPQSQLTREQNDRHAQPRPLVWKRGGKDKGVNVHPRK